MTAAGDAKAVCRRNAEHLAMTNRGSGRRPIICVDVQDLVDSGASTTPPAYPFPVAAGCLPSQRSNDLLSPHESNGLGLAWSLCRRLPGTLGPMLLAVHVTDRGSG